jgi:hypothetical protein
MTKPSQEGDEDGGGDGDEGEAILAPEVAIRNENDKDEILFETACKLFRLDTSGDSKDGEWKDTGKGTFRITRSPDNGGKQRMLVRNIIGKVTLNAGFFKEMKISVLEGKQSAIRFAAFVAEEVVSKGGVGEASTVSKTEMKNFMIKVKPAELQKAAEMIRAGIKSVSV